MVSRLWTSSTATTELWGPRSTHHLRLPVMAATPAAAVAQASEVNRTTGTFLVDTVVTRPAAPPPAQAAPTGWTDARSAAH